MSTRLHLVHWIEATNNVWLGVIDADPRSGAGLANAGIGSIADDLAGNRYIKTGSGATAWALVSDAGAAPLHGTGAPVSGTTGANVVPPGGRYIDDATGQAYANVGTLVSPTWAAILLAESI